MCWELAPPSWEAVATLITGLAAVCAALVVGIRQGDIAKAQVDIQSKLVKIEVLKIRHQLYAERREVEETTYDWLISTLMAGHPPRRRARINKDEVVGESEIKLAQGFHEATIKARHLFGTDVNTMMKEIREAGRIITRAEQAIERKLDAAERKGTKAETDADVESRDEAFRVIEKWFDKSPSLFAPTLSLNEGDLD